jgi:hypothetical protein
VRAAGRAPIAGSVPGPPAPLPQLSAAGPVARSPSAEAWSGSWFGDLEEDRNVEVKGRDLPGDNIRASKGTILRPGYDYQAHRGGRRGERGPPGR